MDRVPTGNDADGREQAGEDDKPKAEAVDTDVIKDGRILNPGQIDLKLKAGLAGDEVRGKMKREKEAHQSCCERYPVGQLGTVGRDRDENGASKRNQEDEGENHWVESVHVLSAPPL